MMEDKQKWFYVVLSWIFIFIIIIKPTISSNSNNIASETCQLETFTAECTHEIILMKTAFYGLMQLGKCLSIDSEHTGCLNNVLTYFDKKCSGKRTCSVDSLDKSLVLLNVNCPRQITPYMETTYTCVEGKYSNIKLDLELKAIGTEMLLLVGHRATECNF